MGYLSNDNVAPVLPDFNQCIISFWFRVPQRSVNAAFSDSRESTPAPMAGIVPLVVMGQTGVGDAPVGVAQVTVPRFYVTGLTWGPGSNVITSTEERTGPNEITVTTVSQLNLGASFSSDSGTDYTTITLTSQAGSPSPTLPTIIGVDCTSTDNDGNVTPRLYVNFETGQTPSLSSVSYEVQSIDPGSSFGPGGQQYEGPVPADNPTGEPCGAYVAGTSMQKTIYSGVIVIQGPVESNIAWVDWPQCNITGTAPVYNYVDISMVGQTQTAAITSDGIPVAPREWHHVLISLDLETIQTTGIDPVSGTFPRGGDLSGHVGSAAHLYIAVDDVNYTGYDLSGDWVGGGDPNAVITDEAYSVAQTFGTVESEPLFPSGETDTVMPLPNYTLRDPVIPVSNQPIGLPATKAFVDNIYDADMAEFQMWVGQWFDTGDVDNRRLFIDAKGGVVSPTVAAKRLGQPDVLLHKTGNWQSGKNTGVSGLFRDGTLRPSGQFTREGTIIPFKPDPKYTDLPVDPQNPASEG